MSIHMIPSTVNSARSTRICVLVQLGQPRYLGLIEKNLRYLYDSEFFDELVLISSETYISQELTSLNIVCIETIYLEHKFPDIVLNWRSNFKPTLDSKFANGFWRHTTERFFYLYLFALDRPDCEFIHIESDYFLQQDFSYESLREWIELNSDDGSRTCYTCFDNSKGIAGIVVVPSPQAILPIVDAALRSPNCNDMMLLQQLKGVEVGVLPNRPSAFPNESDFEPIFDPNYIGQFMYGTDAIANPLRKEFRYETKCFINESSPLKLGLSNLRLGRRNGFTNILLQADDKSSIVFGIHVHSKTLLPWTKRSLRKEEIVTGEMIQAKCDLTIITTLKMKSLRSQGIQPKKLMVLPSGDWTPSPADAGKLVSALDSVTSVFLYGDCTHFFAKVVLPFLNKPTLIFIHNSDETVDPRCEPYISIQKSQMVTKIFAQNLVFESGKFKGIPIGLANSNWGHGDSELVEQNMLNFAKVKMLYVNFEVMTHPSRQHCLNELRRRPWATLSVGKKLPYSCFLSELAAHKFVACPRGNGYDTHRFWEAVYLSAIPVVLRSEVLPVQLEYDPFVVERWEDLSLDSLERFYFDYFTSERSLRLPRLSDYFPPSFVDGNPPFSQGTEK